MILRFLHGWGFDAGFWDELAALLPEWRSESDDRGYFCNPQNFETDEASVIVAHSFGAMRALEALPPACKGLVAINGFDRFIARADLPGVAPRMLDRMIAKFDGAPEAVLADFRRRCGNNTPFGTIGAEPLRRDLAALRDFDRTAEAARSTIPILSVQGAADPILPSTMRDAVFATARDVERVTHPTGGHLLPLTHAPYCASAIRAFVEQMG